MCTKADDHEPSTDCPYYLGLVLYKYREIFRIVKLEDPKRKLKLPWECNHPINFDDLGYDEFWSDSGMSRLKSFVGQ